MNKIKVTLHKPAILIDPHKISPLSMTQTQYNNMYRDMGPKGMKLFTPDKNVLYTFPSKTENSRFGTRTVETNR